VHPNRLLDPLDLNTPNSHEKINVKDLPDFESLNRVKITLAAPLVPVCASFIFVVFFTTASASFCCESAAGDRNPSQINLFWLLSLYLKNVFAGARARLTVNEKSLKYSRPRLEP
jgi:hypothetical protein